jgi:hypothetical protein
MENFKKPLLALIVITLVWVIIYYGFIRKKTVESNWKPEYADPNKLKRSMMGMASEGNSVAGMIANPEYGAMVHHQKKIKKSFVV